jgi:hypothetical protein
MITRWTLLLLLLFTASSATLCQATDINSYARKAPDHLAQRPAELVAYLIAPATNETEKALSLFSWITAFLEYDEAASQQDRRVNHSVEDILSRRKGVCYDYAILFEALCQHAGLGCYRVDGYAFASLGQRQLPTTPNHSWNAVRLDSTWYLLDPTWGYVSDELALTFNHDYFLTPPATLIYNHLPANPVWQLLDPPIGPATFEGGQSQIAAALEHSSSSTAALDTFLQQSQSLQKVSEAKASYDFYPTQDNLTYYAQLRFDYAVEKSSQADSLQEEQQYEPYLLLQNEILMICDEVKATTELFPWQVEFIAQVHINQAVALSRLESSSSGLFAEPITLAIEHLQKAKVLLQQLPEDNYFRQYAIAQCEQYLEFLEDY